MIARLQKLEGNKVMFRVALVEKSLPDRQLILDHSEKIAQVETWEFLQDGKIAYYLRFADSILLKIRHDKI